MFTALRRLAARAARCCRTRDLDRDFAQELESHLAMLTDDNIRRGMAPGRGAPRGADSARAVLVHQRAASRGARAAGCRQSVLQDLRFASRLIAKDRWFSAAAIAALALGIGANTVGFTIVNAAFLRGLPFRATPTGCMRCRGEPTRAAALPSRGPSSRTGAIAAGASPPSPGIATAR